MHHRPHAAAVCAVAHAQLPAVVLHDAEADRQPQPGAFIDGFGGKKRVENLVERVFADAAAFVFNQHSEGIGRAFGGDGNAPFARRGVDGIAHEVDDHLANLIGVEARLALRRDGCRVQEHIRRHRLRLQAIDQFRNPRGDVYRLVIGRQLAGEVHYPAHDVADAFRLGAQIDHIAMQRRLLCAKLALDQRGERQNVVERVVDFMADARRHFTHRGELGLLHHLPLCPLAQGFFAVDVRRQIAEGLLQLPHFGRAGIHRNRQRPIAIGKLLQASPQATDRARKIARAQARQQQAQPQGEQREAPQAAVNVGKWCGSDLFRQAEHDKPRHEAVRIRVIFLKIPTLTVVAGHKHAIGLRDRRDPKAPIINGLGIHRLGRGVRLHRRDEQAVGFIVVQHQPIAHGVAGVMLDHHDVAQAGAGRQRENLVEIFAVGIEHHIPRAIIAGGAQRVDRIQHARQLTGRGIPQRRGQHQKTHLIHRQAFELGQKRGVFQLGLHIVHLRQAFEHRRCRPPERGFHHRIAGGVQNSDAAQARHRALQPGQK